MNQLDLGNEKIGKLIKKIDRVKETCKYMIIANISKNVVTMLCSAIIAVILLKVELKKQGEIN